MLQQQVEMHHLLKVEMVGQVQFLHYQVHQQLMQVEEEVDKVQHLNQQDQVEPEVVEQVL